MSQPVHFPWLFLLQSLELAQRENPPLLPTGQVQVFANTRLEVVHGGHALDVTDGFKWIHTSNTGAKIAVQKGFTTAEAASASAQARAQMSGATYLPLAVEGRL
jgi:L-fucose isomerase-like protein